LRNGLDYLKTYHDPERAARYLEQADARRNELTPAEQESLDSALAAVSTQLAGRAPASEESASLPPRPQTAVAVQAPSPGVGLPSLPVLDPVPGPGFGPEPGVVRTSGEADPGLERAPASQVAEAPEREPQPNGEPIGLTVLSDPADQLAGLDSEQPGGAVMPPAEAMPALAPSEGAVPPSASDGLEGPSSASPNGTGDGLGTMTGQGVEGPSSAMPALEAQAEPPALEGQPEPVAEAPGALDVSEPPALPALPGPALEETEPMAMEPEPPLPLAAPDTGSELEAPAEAVVPPVLPPDDASLAAPAENPDVMPAPAALPEESELILAPPEEVAAPRPAPVASELPSLPTLPGLPALPDEPTSGGPYADLSGASLPPLPVQGETAGLEVPPRALEAPAPVELPQPAEVGYPNSNPEIVNAAAAPTTAQRPRAEMPVEPPPAPDASELPGIDLSAVRPGAPSNNAAPIADPAPIANPAPRPVSPPPAEAVPIRQAQAPGRLLGPNAAQPPMAQGTAALSPETLREVEEIARRQEEEMRRNPNPYDMPPAQPAGPGGPDGTLRYPPDPSGTRAELPRAPSPTEARPIRPIPVPEETVQLPARVFDPNRKYWAAPAVCSMPLYFQDAVLERYGQNVEQAMGPVGRFFSYPIDDPRQSNQRIQILQPFYSAGLFALQVAALPYNMVVDPPWESHYMLGYFRPGDPTPPDLYYLPTTGLGPPLHGRRYGRGYDNK
jgi:hypothetical protein